MTFGGTCFSEDQNVSFGAADNHTVLPLHTCGRTAVNSEPGRPSPWGIGLSRALSHLSALAKAGHGLTNQPLAVAQRLWFQLEEQCVSRASAKG